MATAEDAAISRWKRADLTTQDFVLRLARRAFEAYATRREVIAAPRVLPPLLRGRGGVFVSTMRGGAPRTCMGSLYPTQPSLAQEIIAAAVASAGRDRRFRPVQPRELKSLVLMVSSVGAPRAIRESEALRLDPTRDGLAVRCGRVFGVVLSGETATARRMMHWGRVRAGARQEEGVEYFHVDVARFVERRQTLPLRSVQSVE